MSKNAERVYQPGDSAKSLTIPSNTFFDSSGVMSEEALEILWRHVEGVYQRTSA